MRERGMNREPSHTQRESLVEQEGKSRNHGTLRRCGSRESPLIDWEGIRGGGGRWEARLALKCAGVESEENADVDA
jgi:hypothetical protein